MRICFKAGPTIRLLVSDISRDRSEVFTLLGHDHRIKLNDPVDV